MIFIFAKNITKYLLFLSVLVYGTELSVNPADSTSSLEKLQERIVGHQKSRNKNWFLLEVTEMDTIPFKTFIRDMESMEVSAFVIFWGSNGEEIRITSRATRWNFLKTISERKGNGEKIFTKMKEYYEQYLNKNLLKELVASNPAVNKEELISDAMGLYFRKFRFVWNEIGDTKLKKFDYMPQVFSFFRKVADYGIYRSIEHAFRDIFRNLNDPNQVELVYTRKKQFHGLVNLLSIDEKENWGLRWAAQQNDLFLILSFFFYQQVYPQQQNTFISEIIKKNKQRENEFSNAFSVLQEKMKFKIIREGSKLKFCSDFKNPFPPHIMDDNELKNVLSTLFSKMYSFCFPSLNE